MLHCARFTHSQALFAWPRPKGDPMAMPYIIDFEVGATAALEHTNIFRARKAASGSEWETGARLARSAEKEEWRQLTDPAYSDWSTYLREGLSISLNTAYKWMRAARWERRLSLAHGIEKMSLLSQIVELTAVEETAEQALRLELPLTGGGNKPFADMTVAEVEEAYRLMREGEAKAKHATPTKPKNPEAVSLEELAEEAVDGLLTPEQILCRFRDGEPELGRVPGEAIRRQAGLRGAGQGASVVRFTIVKLAPAAAGRADPDSRS
ncbi:MAG: hypothetical protein QM765_43915 [Myxococcales bacterium]